MKTPETLTLADLRRMIEPLGRENQEATARAIFELCRKAQRKETEAGQ